MRTENGTAELLANIMRKAFSPSDTSLSCLSLRGEERVKPSSTFFFVVDSLRVS